MYDSIVCLGSSHGSVPHCRWAHTVRGGAVRTVVHRQVVLPLSCMAWWETVVRFLGRDSGERD